MSIALAFKTGPVHKQIEFMNNLTTTELIYISLCLKQIINFPLL